MKRRRFLQQSFAATSALGFPAILSSASPNSHLQVACIGVGGMGGATMRSVASHPKVKITALCDVDAVKMDQGEKDFPDASQHTDWRQMLASHAEKFDAVTIATPDHMHAPICVTALRAKKHVYLQKPIAPTVYECRVIVAEAAKAGVITQLGNQGRSSVEGRMMAELLRSGAIGKVKEIIFWENKKLGWWPKNSELRATGDAIPATFDWDSWVGVSEARPYLAGTYHPESWRAWHNFGVGELGDMGAHHFDSSLDGLSLQPPTRVRQTHTGEMGAGLWAKEREVEFEFPGNEMISGDTLKLRWLDGEHAPEAGSIPLPKGLTKFPLSGGYWIGEKGAIFKAYTQRPYVLPEESFPAEKYPRNFGKKDHYHDFVDAVFEGRQAASHFEHGAKLTEIIMVGTLAEQTPNEWLTWDTTTGKTNSDKVNATLIPSYRDGWKVEGLA